MLSPAVAVAATLTVETETVPVVRFELAQLDLALDVGRHVDAALLREEVVGERLAIPWRITSGARPSPSRPMDAPWTRSRSRTGALCPAISPPPSTSLRAFPVTSQAHRGPSSSALLAAVNDSSRWSRQVRGRHRDAIPATPRPPTSALHPAGSTCFRQCRTQAGIGRSVGAPIDRLCRAHPQRAGERRAALGRERAGPKGSSSPREPSMACCRRSRFTASSSRIATRANTSPAPACCNSAPPTSTSTSFALARWCTPSGSPAVAMPPCASVLCNGASVIVVHHVFRPDETLQILEVGAQLPIHSSALGKAILAYLPSSVVDDLTAEPLPRLTSRMLSARELRASCARSSRASASAASRASATRRSSAKRASQRRSSTSAGTRSARWAWSATPSGSCRAGRRRASSPRSPRRPQASPASSERAPGRDRSRRAPLIR
jgi:hypothetical protein